MATKNLSYHTQVLDELEKIPLEYLPSLLKVVQAFREGVTLASAEDTFRQGWQEVMSGEIRPISELWNEDDT